MFESNVSRQAALLAALVFLIVGTLGAVLAIPSALPLFPLAAFLLLVRNRWIRVWTDRVGVTYGKLNTGGIGVGTRFIAIGAAWLVAAVGYVWAREVSVFVPYAFGSLGICATLVMARFPRMCRAKDLLLEG